MAGRLNAIVVAPMGGGKKSEEKPAAESEGSEDGLRESFDEMCSALGVESSDDGFEAMRSFMEQVAYQCMDR